MGKNQRHKKVVKSEKSKIKLKAGAKTKFLPKGTNVTDINFKVKPIILVEQLKANKFDEPLTRKKLNFKDLLVRLNHHNSSAKNEACEGLIELIKSSPSNVLELHLYSIVHGVCKLVLDVERKVRQKAIKLLSDLIEKVSSEKFFPFSDMLTSYASCAMTHIDKGIQEDSLLIIDLCLKHAPRLIVTFFDKIFNNFLTLISKLRSDSKLSRTLTVNLSSKMTSSKWRIKVLTRLQGILQLIINEKLKVNEVQHNCKAVVLDETSNTVALYKGVQYCQLNFLNYKSAVEVHSKSKIQEQVELLVPLLYETWAEVVPLINVGNMNDGATIIGQDAASILSCVMGIFHLLWELVKSSSEKNDENEMKKLFLSKDGQKFASHIFNQFPYRQQDLQKRKLPKNETLVELNTDSKCVEENLLICYMFCILYKAFPSVYYVTKAHEILDYLKMCLVNRNYVSTENIETLILVLRIIFFENSKTWSQNGVGVEELLDNAIKFHNNLSKDSTGKTNIFYLLCDVIHLPHLTSHKYEVWLSKLPALLCKPEISVDVVNTLSLLCRQNNKLFLDGLMEELPNILDNLPSIKINGSDLNVYPPHLKIVCMFHYLSMKPEQVEYLRKFVKINEKSKMAMYIQEVLQEKSIRLKKC